MGGDTMTQWLSDPSRLASLKTLQRGLLRNGFRLLKPDGALVYSTCSLAKAQNEDVVSWLTGTCADARVVPIDGAEAMPCEAGSIKNTLRFNPGVSETGGFFMAKIVKLSPSPDSANA